jgi:hypothetical protein
MYQELKSEGANWLELPTQSVLLKSAFTGKVQRVKRQVLVPLTIHTANIEQVMLISPKLITPLILGMDFCIENQIIIDCPKAKIIMNAYNKRTALNLCLENKRSDSTEDKQAGVSYLQTADDRTMTQSDRHQRLPGQENPSIQCQERRCEVVPDTKEGDRRNRFIDKCTIELMLVPVTRDI